MSQNSVHFIHSGNTRLSQQASNVGSIGRSHAVARNLQLKRAVGAAVQLLLFAALLLATSAFAQNYLAVCKQNGGASLCTPVRDNGWNYLFDYCCGQTCGTYSSQESDLDTLIHDFVRDARAA